MGNLGIILLSYFSFFLFALLRETTFSMVFSLIIVFMLACILVFNFKFYFLGFMILIIYLGAIAVLFLFMVMLFDRAEYKIFSVTSKNNKSYLFLFISFLFSLLLTFLIFYILYQDVICTSGCYMEKVRFFLKDYNSIYSYINLFFGHRISSLNENFNIFLECTDAQLIGIELFQKYFFLLFMSGLGLLVAMIGCILITKSSFLDKFQRRNQSIEKQLSRFKI